MDEGTVTKELREQTRRIRASIANSLRKEDTEHSGMVDFDRFMTKLKSMKINLANEDVQLLKNRADTNNKISYTNTLKRLKLYNRKGINVWYVHKKSDTENFLIHDKVRNLQPSPENFLVNSFASEYSELKKRYSGIPKRLKPDPIHLVILHLQKAKLDDRALDAIKKKVNTNLSFEEFNNVLSRISYKIKDPVKDLIVKYCSEKGKVSVSKLKKLIKAYKYSPVTPSSYFLQLESNNVKEVLSEEYPLYKKIENKPIRPISRNANLTPLVHRQKDTSFEYGRRKTPQPNIKKLLSHNYSSEYPQIPKISTSGQTRSFRRGLGLIGELSLAY